MTMQVSGEFQILDKRTQLIRVVPNHFTILGMQQLLRAAFWHEELEWLVGLCNANQADSLQLALVGEPDATNGYARQNLLLNTTNWPTISIVNGESFVESREFTFTATGAYSESVSRMFLTDGEHVIAVSSPIFGGLQIMDEDFVNKYRLYFR